MKINFNTLLILVTLFLIAVVAAVALNQAFYKISNQGTVKTVGVDVDIECIEWGFMAPAQNKSSPSFTVINNGTIPVILNMTTENWIPASEFFTCGWNLESTILPANENATAIVWLYVDANIENVTSFNFDIVIWGTETA